MPRTSRQRENCSQEAQKTRRLTAQPLRAETGLFPSKAIASKDARHIFQYVALLSHGSTPLTGVFSILLKEPLALRRGGNMFFRSILRHRPSRDDNLLGEQPRGNLFIFERVARVFLRHHFANHLSDRHG